MASALRRDLETIEAFTFGIFGDEEWMDIEFQPKKLSRGAL
jgi:hypothetical protein